MPGALSRAAGNSRGPIYVEICACLIGRRLTPPIRLACGRAGNIEKIRVILAAAGFAK